MRAAASFGAAALKSVGDSKDTAAERIEFVTAVSNAFNDLNGIVYTHKNSRLRDIEEADAKKLVSVLDKSAIPTVSKVFPSGGALLMEYHPQQFDLLLSLRSGKSAESS